MTVAKKVSVVEQRRIFIVEDDDSIRNLTRIHLQMNGFENVYSISDADSAWILANRIHPDIVLLDLMLPGMDGLTFMNKLRHDPLLKDTVIIIITAKDSEEDIIEGLERGADDYITKPFTNNVLLARLKVHLKRLSVNNDSCQLSAYGGLNINFEARIVYLNGNKIPMTADEFDTLSLLVQNPDKVYTRRQIIECTKGSDYPATDRVVDIRMMKLRRKLGVWAEHLITVRGVGYKVTGL